MTETPPTAAASLCDRYQTWLAESDGAFAPAGSVVALHARECPECARLATRYERARDTFIDATLRPSPLGAEEAFIAAALLEQRPAPRTRAWPRVAWMAGASMAAALLAVVLWSHDGAEDGAKNGANDGAKDGASLPHPAPESEPGFTPQPPGKKTWSAGTRLEAPPEAAIEGALAQVGSVKLAPGSAARVDAWAQHEVSLSLERGAVMCQVEPLRPGGSYEVRTPYARVQVVGTVFEVIHEPGVRTHVRVREGEVNVLDADGRWLRRLRSGETFDVGASSTASGAGNAPAEPPTTAPPPEPLAPTPAPPAQAEGTPPKRVAPKAPAARRAAPAPVATAEPNPAVCRAHLAAGRDAEALECVRSARAAAPEPSAMLAELEADALRLAGERGQAALLYLEAAALSASPERARLHAARAEMWETAPPKPEAAEQAWNEVLASAPTERLAAKALLRLGALAQQRGAIDLAAQRFASLMQQYPSAPEAASALALWGKSKLDAQQWAQAESLFVAHRDAPAALLAETALVGWVRAQVGKADRAAALTGIREHQERFPNGARRHEIERLRRALSDGD